jgi:hypothetical protein
MGSDFDTFAAQLLLINCCMPYIYTLPLSTKECNSCFSMSQTIWTLTKDTEESNNIHETK